MKAHQEAQEARRRADGGYLDQNDQKLVTSLGAHRSAFAAASHDRGA